MRIGRQRVRHTRLSFVRGCQDCASLQSSSPSPSAPFSEPESPDSFPAQSSSTPDTSIKGLMETLADIAKSWSELAHRANYSTTALASFCGVSVRQLERDFQRVFRQSPKNWLKALRLRAARKLLRDGGSVKETALSFGYRHPQHFSRDFRKFFGVSPSCELQDRAISRPPREFLIKESSQIS